jgi:hypothetical protein
MTRESFKFAKTCADRAGAAMEQYRSTLGETREFDTDHIRDFLQDLLHWIARERDNYCCPECEGSGWPEPIEVLKESCDMACEDFERELDEKYQEQKGKKQ